MRGQNAYDALVSALEGQSTDLPEAPPVEDALGDVRDVLMDYDKEIAKTSYTAGFLTGLVVVSAMYYFIGSPRGPGRRQDDP